MMTNPIRSLGVSALLVMSSAVVWSGQDDKPTSSPPRTEGVPSMELKGKLLPLSGKTNQPAFQAESGTVYLLVSNRMSLALFTDTNLLGKTLVLKGRASSEQPLRFEVTGNLRSLHEGRIHELYYYCDICSIKGSDPGLCMCCREPVHLIEAPPGSEAH